MARTKGSIKLEIHYLKQDLRGCKQYIKKWGSDDYHQKRLDYCVLEIDRLNNVLKKRNEKINKEN